MVGEKKSRKDYLFEYVRRPDVRKRNRKQLREWRKSHPLTEEQKQHQREHNQQYYRNKQMNDLKYRKNKVEYYQKHMAEIRAKIFGLLGGQCVNSYGLHDRPFIDVRCLQIDHVNGGGRQQRKKIGNSSTKYYKYILEHPNEFQILCSNCNQIKRIENKEN